MVAAAADELPGGFRPEAVRSLFLIGTPLQLLNADEALHHFGCDPDSSLLVLLDNHSALNSRQLRGLAADQRWPQVVALPSHRRRLLARLRLARRSAWKRPLIRAAERVLYRALGIEVEQAVLGRACFREIRRLGGSLGPLDRLFIGYYGSPIMRHLANRLRSRELVVLEEGANQLGLYEDLHSAEPRFARRYYLDRRGNLVKRVLYGVDLRPIEPLHLFTAYDLEETDRVRITRNGYRRFRDRIADAEAGDEVFLLGEWLTQWHCCTDDEYAAWVEQIRDRYPGRSLVFIPHRRTPASTEARLRQIAGLELRRLDGPVELVLASMRRRPATVAAFFSSGLFNLAMLYGRELELHAYRAPVRFPTAEIRSYIGGYYRHARQHFADHIEVFDIR